MNSPALLLTGTTPVIDDLTFIGVAVTFFALAVAYAWFCKKVR